LQGIQHWKNISRECREREGRGDLVGGYRRIDKTRFEVFKAALLRIVTFWEEMLCH
jgi:hypothetical protein